MLSLASSLKSCDVRIGRAGPPGPSVVVQMPTPDMTVVGGRSTRNTSASIAAKPFSQRAFAPVLRRETRDPAKTPGSGSRLRLKAQGSCCAWLETVDDWGPLGRTLGDWETESAVAVRSAVS
jgi:hypothetical protein